MKIFFSHSGLDKEIVHKLIELIDGDRAEIFYSSKPDLGVEAGESIMGRINEELENCDVFVPVITQNYVRSLYCIYELSVATYLKQKRKFSIIPISKRENLRGRIDSLLPADILFIDVSNKTDRAKRFKKLPTTKSDADIDAVLEAINGYSGVNRPFIGMTKSEYDAVMHYCEQYKILAFRNTVVPAEKVAKHVSGAKEVTILSTTGASLIKSLCAGALVDAIANGTRVNVIIPNQYSDFCEDVAEIERPTAKEENLERLSQEYTAVMGYLNEAVEKAKQLGYKNDIGSVACYCAYNILRQTVLLTVSREGEMWGNISLTIPPKKTVDGTPSIEVAGKEGVAGSLAEIMREHCSQIIAMAERRGGVIKITGEYKTEVFFAEKRHAKKFWTEKYEKAVAYTNSKREECSDILIEVAAQHPLKSGEKPGTEFTKRLDAALELYRKLTDRGENVYIYVPGSVHKTATRTDKVSLSYAGCEYLVSHGVARENVLGDDANIKYKGDDGVYNSADECFVASALFKDGDFKKLYCVCSPNQVMRKTLFYMHFGVMAQCYCVPSDTMYHKVLDEIFNSLENVVYRDHSWQDKSGERFISSRKERKPE